MKKDPRIFLDHVLESINDIQNYTSGISKEKFLRDKKTQDAVVRRLEIIGEAIKKLPAAFIKKYKKIAWRKAAGMRDVLIHEYFGVNVKIVWKTVEKDIPKLKSALKKILVQLDAKASQLRIY